MHIPLHFRCGTSIRAQPHDLVRGAGAQVRGEVAPQPPKGEKRGTRATLVFVLLLITTLSASAATRRYRMTWQDDPATSAVIGFEQYSGSAVHLVYDVVDHGNNSGAYRLTARPARQTKYGGMTNVFVRIGGLTPGTKYYFMVVDSDGASQRMIFETPPGSPDRQLSIVAGGDSRNNRAVTQKANRLVARLRPHFVLFGGDMTGGDTPLEWQQWFDDWQLTISADGRLTPIVPARGNHESSNRAIHDLFDVPNPNVFYAFDFGGGLLRTLTLNSSYPPGGEQLQWLDRTLATARAAWKIGQYHHAMRPHTSRKKERDELIAYWGTRFSQYGVDVVIESDAHTVKQTWPIRPSREAGASQGFIRDDRRGTVYLGEGGWGAPLRANDDDKPWTRASGRFNQFKWIWVNLREIQVRTVMIDRSSGSAEVADNNRFRSPAGFYYWEADNTGDVLRIPRRGAANTAATRQQAPLSPAQQAVIRSPDPPAALTRNPQGQVLIPFRLVSPGTPEILVVGAGNRILYQGKLSARGPGPYNETVSLPALPRGQRMELILKCGGKLVRKYDLR